MRTTPSWARPRRRRRPRAGPRSRREDRGAVREATEAAGVAVGELRGLGVGSPGAVERDAGTVAHARNLPDWDEPFPLAATLGDALGTTVRVENDVKVAVTAELELGAGRPYASFLGVWWGTGVGGGLVLDRKLWRGRGAAGEIGHIVIRRNGARCPCGRRGCLEAYAGRGAMEARMRGSSSSAGRRPTCSS